MKNAPPGGTRSQVIADKAPKNISVFLRVRPPIARELQAKHTFDNLQVHPDDPTKVTIQKKADKSSVAKTYAFNKVWSHDVSQKTVYDDFARGAVDAAFEGQHGVLFVYGQTGSGKTFTISNEDQESLGVLQQSMLEVWGRILKDKTNEYSCSVSYVQLYNEILTDLLDAGKGRVRLQTGAEGRGDVVMVSEATGLGIERTVTNYMETMDLFKLGMDRKEMQSTEMNLTSSRSHTIFSFHIHKASKIRAVTARTDEDTGLVPSIALEGRLVLCDLAGSERVSKTHAAGEQLIQASYINSSLLVLGKVVAALIDKKAQHAPFRESKLTRLLQYSLLGNGNTSIVINVSPSDDNTEETHSAIQFGQRAIQIKQEAKRHEVLDYKALYLQLQADLETKQDDTLLNSLEEQKRDFEEKVARLKEELQLAEQTNEMLRKENDELRAAAAANAAALRGGATPQGAAAAASAAASGSSPDAGSPTNKSKSAEVIVAALRQMIRSRDEKLEEINSERLQLGKILGDERLKVFKLGTKMQALVVQYERDMASMSAKIYDLNSELAKVRGTDFLDIAAGSGGDVDLASPASAHGRSLSDAFSANGDGGAADGGRFSKMHQAFELINALRQEKTDLLVYQRLAEKAIKLLHSEKEALRARLAQLTAGAS